MRRSIAPVALRNSHAATRRNAAKAVGKRDPGREFWALIEPYTGTISVAWHTECGYSADVTVIVECARGPLFVKAVREPSRHESSFAREAAINIDWPDVMPHWPETQWNQFTDHRAFFAGDRLLYTDINPDSLPIRDGSVSVVD
jgi:hypothetical protein